MTKEELDLLQREAGKTPTVQMQEYLCDFEKRQKKRGTSISLFQAIMTARPRFFGSAETAA